MTVRHPQPHPLAGKTVTVTPAAPAAATPPEASGE